MFGDLMGMMGKLKETQAKVEATKERLNSVYIDESSIDGLLKVTLTGNLIGLQVGQGENEQMQQLFTVHDCMLWAQTYLLRESMSALEQSSLIKVLDENQGHHVVGTRAVQSLSGMLRFLPSVSPQQEKHSF